jgi:hypothetical protein
MAALAACRKLAGAVRRRQAQTIGASIGCRVPGGASPDSRRRFRVRPLRVPSDWIQWNAQRAHSLRQPTPCLDGVGPCSGCDGREAVGLSGYLDCAAGFQETSDVRERVLRRPHERRLAVRVLR